MMEAEYVRRCQEWIGRYVTKWVLTRAGAYWLIEKVVAVDRRTNGQWIVWLERVNDDARSIPPGTRQWVSAIYFDREMRPGAPLSVYRETLTGSDREKPRD